MTTLISSRFLQVILLSVLFCASAACNGKGEFLSPAAPSGGLTDSSKSPASGTTTGATISGTVTGLASGASSLRAIASTITVRVVGTSASALVGSDGTFSLADVPPGDAQLEFSGGGVVATLTVSGVQQLERITIVVVVSGSTATLESNLREASDSRVELEGPITALDVTARTLQVMGTMVSVPVDATVVHGSTTVLFADLNVGDIVHVKGARTATGVTAREVFVQNPVGTPLGDVVLEGAVSAVSGCPTPTLTIDGKTITTTADTRILAGGCSDIIVGITVEVKGTSRPDGSIRASQIRIERGQTVQVEGTVTAVSGCPTPTITVSGKLIKSSADTKFIGGVCGDVTVGSSVQVMGTALADGSVLAMHVKIEKTKDHDEETDQEHGQGGGNGKGK